MVDQNMCPVCGYGMEEPPEQYNICASCGTEFGVHDVNASIEELRVAWLRTGPNWFSSVDPEPQDWDPFLQIMKVMPSVLSHAGNAPDPINEGVESIGIPFSDIEPEVVFV